MNIPNFLTMMRLPLAILFIFSPIEWRIIIIILAMVTDGLDGLLARRWNQTTYFGTIIDPIMDKLFAMIVMGTFLWEYKLSIWECTALLSRDFAVSLYGLLLSWQGRIRQYQVRAIWSGKIATTMQFAVFLALLWGIAIPQIIYISFVIIGCIAFAELLFREEQSAVL